MRRSRGVSRVRPPRGGRALRQPARPEPRRHPATRDRRGGPRATPLAQPELAPGSNRRRGLGVRAAGDRARPGRSARARRRCRDVDGADARAGSAGDRARRLDRPAGVRRVVPGDGRCSRMRTMSVAAGAPGHPGCGFPCAPATTCGAAGHPEWPGQLDVSQRAPRRSCQRCSTPSAGAQAPARRRTRAPKPGARRVVPGHARSAAYARASLLAAAGALGASTHLAHPPIRRAATPPRSAR